MMSRAAEQLDGQSGNRLNASDLPSPAPRQTRSSRGHIALVVIIMLVLVAAGAMEAAAMPSSVDRSAVSGGLGMAGAPSWRTWVWRGLLMVVVGGLVLYGLLPRTVDLWSQVPRLRSIGLVALASVALLQFASLWCSAEVDRGALMGMSRFVAIASSLVSNAVSRVVPAAGGALGVGVSYRMWTDSCVDVGSARARLPRRR